MQELLEGGMKWEESTAASGGTKWSSECGDYEILKIRDGKYRLVSFKHEPVQQFPDAEFWMREYRTLLEAAHQAEVM